MRAKKEYESLLDERYVRVYGCFFFFFFFSNSAQPSKVKQSNFNDITVEPLCKDFPKLRTSPLTRTLSMVPAT